MWATLFASLPAWEHSGKKVIFQATRATEHGIIVKPLKEEWGQARWEPGDLPAGTVAAGTFEDGERR